MDDQANQAGAPAALQAPSAPVLTEPVQASAAPVILPAALPVASEPVIAPAPAAAQSVVDPTATGSLPKPSMTSLEDFDSKPPSGPLASLANIDLGSENPMGDRHDRARALVDGYQHALATNSPRTVAELAELKALLDV